MTGAIHQVISICHIILKSKDLLLIFEALTAVLLNTKSRGMWHCTVEQVLLNTEGSRCLSNVWKYTPKNTGSHPLV